MTMFESNPRKLALIVAAVLSLFSTLIIFILFSINPPKELFWISIPIVAITIGLIQFVVMQYVIEHFIYNRIKLIFKTIHKLKLSKEDKKEQKSNIQGDIIRTVNEEVENWANDRKEEIDELKKMEIYRREFLGNVSHELKTPLFNLQGFILTLLDGGINDEKINIEYLNKSQKNIDRMITIVEDLEIISRLETGEAVPVFTTFSITLLIREVMEFLEPKAKERHIRLTYGSEYSDNLMVNADKEKIRTVLNNLIENSLKYGLEGGRTKISIYDMDENYLLEVSDNGVGIEEQHIDRLFERFYRVDKHRSRAQGGSGLGLAIVKHILEAHEQTINVRSAPNIGTTFSFTLAKA